MSKELEMIINDSDAIARLNSPMNLINKLAASKSNRKSAMSLFIPPAPVSPIKTMEPIPAPAGLAPPVSISQPQASSPPQASEASLSLSLSLDNIINNNESQIKLSLAHDHALELLNTSISALALKLDDVRADKLPQVIAAASKTVESIRRERSESARSAKDREVHYHFYTPQQKSVSDYEIIDVGTS